MSYKLFTAIILFLLISCTNPFAPKLVYENLLTSSFLTEQKSPKDVLSNFRYAYIFKDSLMLRDNKYYQVFTLPGVCSSPERLHPDTLFYTKTEGVIGLKFTDGNLWTKL